MNKIAMIFSTVKTASLAESVSIITFSVLTLIAMMFQGINMDVFVGSLNILLIVGSVFLTFLPVAMLRYKIYHIIMGRAINYSQLKGILTFIELVVFLFVLNLYLSAVSASVLGFVGILLISVFNILLLVLEGILYFLLNKKPIAI